jgi:hypothetical protein
MQLRDLYDKADVLPIIKAHMATMSSARTGTPMLTDYLFFFGIPVILGAGLAATGFGFRVDAVAGFLNAFAILTGLLLNLLVLVFTISVTTSSSERADVQTRRKVLKEIFTNVCYCIIVAVVATGTALIALSYMRSVSGAQTGSVATFVLCAVTMNFVFSLMMILKRMYKLISTEFDISGKKAA